MALSANNKNSLLQILGLLQLEASPAAYPQIAEQLSSAAKSQLSPTNLAHVTRVLPRNASGALAGGAAALQGLIDDVTAN
jgi:hypothetical protein